MSEFESSEQLLQQSLAHHQAGQLDLAERGYRAVLQVLPEQADALHLLGILLFQRGNYAPAIELLRRAISIRPAEHEQWINLARVLAADGQLDALLAAYQSASEQMRSHAALHFGFSRLFIEKGMIDSAIIALQRATSARPDHFEAWATLGELFLAMGKADEAIHAVQNASRLQPMLPGPYLGLTVALLMRKQNDLAFQAAQKAISLDGTNPTALRLLAVVESARGRQIEAAQWAQRGLSLDPDMPELHCILGSTLIVLGQNEQAIESLTRAVQLRPYYLEALHDLGFALLRTGKIDAAIATYRQAIAINPDWALAHHALGHALLLRGDYRSGFPEYEWRYKSPELGIICQDFPQPRWDGADLNGRTILVHAEQGFGDTIQFARYLLLPQFQNGKILLQCQPELKELLNSLDPKIQILARAEPLPSFDLHCPLLSLPNVLGTTIETIPAKVPYLSADPALVNQWKARMPRQAPKAVGIVFAGGPQLRGDPSRQRSVPLESLEPILQIPGIDFFSLQTGADARPHQAFRNSDLPITFSDTAAMMQNLDLIITIDTAAAHLAGAMGKPTWLILPHLPDWRWLLDRSDCPWYPGMRLFRAPKPRDWETPIRQIAEALRLQQ